MSGFKLIAIRPLKDCDSRFLRILEEDKLYPFYSGYDFKFEKNEIVSITETTDVSPSNLYNVEIASGKSLEVNISAVVGKNGSGKSSIIELLYAALFNISVKAELLPIENEDGEPILFEENLRVELYYLISGKYYLLKLFDEFLSVKNITAITVKNIDKDSFLSSELFYTIAINYSHYALNSEHLGDWVKNIFHKNDGYQTPLVLNPFRKKGNININEEEYLTKSRLLANIISPTSEKGPFWINKRRTLIPDKVATSIKFSIDDEKIKKVNKYLGDNTLLDKHYSKIIDTIYDHLISKEKQEFKNTFNLDFVNKYLVVKIFNISQKYKPYNEEFRFLASRKLNEEKLIGLLQKLKTETSHIAFKLHQTINFIENSDFIVNRMGNWVPLSRLNEFINSIEKESTNNINFLPPSFFKYDLRFKKDKETLNTLSSGEKQRIFSSSTYKYHLYNLDTVTEKPFKIYENINIIFDEIELYYHPDFQKTFISDFLESLKTLQLKRIKRINCIMVTHSPFILSDIPVSNTLKLIKGLPDESIGDKQTFGSNIHDLLANDFFMSDGFMGEWAKKKIKSVADYLTFKINTNKLDLLYSKQQLNESNEDNAIENEIKKLRKEIEESVKNNLSLKECEELISIVGEPVLYNSLMEMYVEAFSNIGDEFIDSQIKKLTELKNSRR